MYKKKYTFQWIGHGQHSFILVIKLVIFKMTVEQKVLVISSGVEGREPGEKFEILKLFKESYETFDYVCADRASQLLITNLEINYLDGASL